MCSMYYARMCRPEYLSKNCTISKFNKPENSIIEFVFHVFHLNALLGGKYLAQNNIPRGFIIFIFKQIFKVELL